MDQKRKWEDPLLQHHKNIAAALQERLEYIVLRQLKIARKKFKLKKLCLSGGVALNCSLNGKIAKSKIFNEIFIQPASGDDGTAYGSCLLGYASSKKNFFQKKCIIFIKGQLLQKKTLKKNY